MAPVVLLRRLLINLEENMAKISYYTAIKVKPNPKKKTPKFVVCVSLFQKGFQMNHRDDTFKDNKATEFISSFHGRILIKHV